MSGANEREANLPPPVSNSEAKKMYLYFDSWFESAFAANSSQIAHYGEVSLQRLTYFPSSPNLDRGQPVEVGFAHDMASKHKIQMRPSRTTRRNVLVYVRLVGYLPRPIRYLGAAFLPRSLSVVSVGVQTSVSEGCRLCTSELRISSTGKVGARRVSTY